jgi:hypothetical protein
VHVSYGRRTNRFLLVWYGFVIDNNKYSSYNFRVLYINIYKYILFVKIVMDEIRL